MRVALYARVSTERQERQGTIASRLEALRDFAEVHGHDVVDAYVCVDDGYSGSRLDRPALDRLRDGAEAMPSRKPQFGVPIGSPASTRIRC